MTFWYYLRGETSSSLKFIIESENSTAELWKLDSEEKQTSRWYYGSFDFRSSMPYRITIEGVRGDSTSTLAISDIVSRDSVSCGFHPAEALTTTQVLSFAQAEQEEFYCDFMQDTCGISTSDVDDDFTWVRTNSSLENASWPRPSIDSTVGYNFFLSFFKYKHRCSIILLFLIKGFKQNWLLHALRRPE